jgi:hypothetical protein
MLYGYNVNPRTTIVVAAHLDLELRAWYGRLMQETSTPLYSEQRDLGAFDFLMDDSFKGLTTDVYEFKFETDHNQAEFARVHDIQILPRNNAIDKHEDMNYRSTDNYDTETRTIEEITGTDKHDPWDTTSDEDKAKAKAIKDMMRQRQKNDEVSNDDSFAAPSQGGVHVTNIDAALDADGKVVISGVGAVKLEGDEVERSLEEIERVKQQAYDAGRNPIFDKAVIVDLTQPQPVKPKRTRKKAE